MAKITFQNQSDYFLKLQRLEEEAEAGEVIERAVAKGAAVVADAIRRNLDHLPTDKFRKLKPGETFKGIPPEQKEDLLNSFGLTPIGRDANGFVNTKAGFDGYGIFPTKKYPNGLPNQLLARAVESGSEVRKKTPFVRTAVTKSKTEAVASMEESIDADMKKIV